MADKYRSLFVTDRFPQEYVEGQLRPHLPKLCACIADPWEYLQKCRHRNHPYFNHLEGVSLAQWMHPQVIEMAKRQFAGVSGVRVEDKSTGNQQMFKIVVNDEIELSFKKLNPNTLLRSNATTGHQKQYWRQRWLSPEFEQVKVIFGWSTDPAETTIYLHLTCPRNRRNHWATPIPHAAGSFDMQDSNLTPLDGKGFHVRPTRKRGAKDETG